MERKSGEITELLQEFGSTSKEIAGALYTQMLYSLDQIPHGVNEKIKVRFRGPEIDRDTRDVEYNVKILVTRKYPPSLLKSFGK